MVFLIGFVSASRVYRVSGIDGKIANPENLERVEDAQTTKHYFVIEMAKNNETLPILVKINVTVVIVTAAEKRDVRTKVDSRS